MEDLSDCGRDSSDRSSSRCPSTLEEVTHTVLGTTILVGLVLYRVVQVVWKRWVTHAVRLRRSNVGAIVGSSGIHGRLISRGTVGLVDGCHGTLTDKGRSRFAGLG